MSKGFTTIVIGALWGDEGKGKIGAYIAYQNDYDIAVRAGTGTNAGHSIYIDGTMHKTNQLPIAGIFPNKSGKKMTLAIGSGVCVNPEKLRDEVERFNLTRPNRFVMVDRLCTVIEPKHIERESSGENYSESHTGSTKSGTGEARVDRIKRVGSVYGKYIEEMIKTSWKDSGFSRMGSVAKNVQSVNVATMLNSAYDDGLKIIVEGTQAHFLSLYLSDEYPVVTSDNCTASAFIDDVGLAWNKVDEVCMVIKSAPTRVSQKCGDLPGEISKEEMTEKNLCEYGVTSGRLRRKSLTIPFDLLEEAVQINAPTYFALTFCDHIDSMEFIHGVPSVVSRDEIKEYMPKTYDNIIELEKRFNIPVKYIEYGKEFNCVSEVKG
jgi:adenylosuccinate synthase